MNAFSAEHVMRIATGLALIALMASCSASQTASKPSASAAGSCSDHESYIQIPNGTTQAYVGRGPFYFGLQLGVSDWNKNIWAVDPKFKDRIVVVVISPGPTACSISDTG